MLILTQENEQTLSAFSEGDLRIISKEFADCALELDRLVSERDNSLDPKIQKLERILHKLRFGKLKEKLNRLKAEKWNLETRLKASDSDVAQSIETVSNLQEKIIETEKRLQSARTALIGVEQSLSRQQNFLSDYNKARLFQSIKRDELMKKIAAVGTYTREEVEARKENSVSELMREMRETNEALARFRFVNKRAFEQFRQFRAQREDLERRQEEMIQSENAITALIEDLDRKKTASIRSCFEKVSQGFEYFYKTLNPSGSARIVLKRERESEDIFDVSGIGVVVDDGELEGLSGGQKTVVALALIFAIQQMQPSPFYVFDEVESDLDAESAKNLGELITRLASSDTGLGNATQFIYTTHSDDMIGIGDKFFAVHSIEQGASGVREVTIDQVAEYLAADL
jgi:structural maintenance of chromosome 3 (chondroitin sulfate proteoglycan 6)